jgi:hypothetical protein
MPLVAATRGLIRTSAKDDDVIDPYRLSDEVYATSFEEITAAVESVARREAAVYAYGSEYPSAAREVKRSTPTAAKRRREVETHPHFRTATANGHQARVSRFPEERQQDESQSYSLAVWAPHPNCSGHR